MVKSQTKRKWSMSGLMTAINILLNSYSGLYAFLNAPEKQWLAIIEERKKDTPNLWPNSLFNDQGGHNFECQRTIEAVKASVNDF